MTGVLDTADGPTILAQTDRIKLTEANIPKKDNKRGTPKAKRKLQGSDKLPHQMSSANRLRLICERKKNYHPQRKQYHQTQTGMDSTHQESGSRPPRRDRSARKVSTNYAHARMPRLPQHTHACH